MLLTYRVSLFLSSKDLKHHPRRPSLQPANNVCVAKQKDIENISLSALKCCKILNSAVYFGGSGNPMSHTRTSPSLVPPAIKTVSTFYTLQTS